MSNTGRLTTSLETGRQWSDNFVATLWLENGKPTRGEEPMFRNGTTSLPRRPKAWQLPDVKNKKGGEENMSAHGRVYEEFFTGSMVGTGPLVQWLMMYCIVKVDYRDHTVMLNPKLLFAILGQDEEWPGMTVASIERAIQKLCQPDPASQNKQYGGARLVHRTGYQYFVVSHEKYWLKAQKEARRTYFREYGAKRRHKDDGKPDEDAGEASTNEPPDNFTACIEKFGEGKYEMGKEPLWEKLIAERVGAPDMLPYSKWLELKHLFNLPESHWEGIIEKTLMENANKPIVKVWNWLCALAKGTGWNHLEGKIKDKSNLITAQRVEEEAC